MLDSYAVIGSPISHSLSPVVHRLFAEATQQQLTYEAFDVSVSSLSQALKAFHAQGLRGLNVTMPLKQAAFALMSHCTPRALEAQAVNTITIQANGEFLGDNTDGVGLVSDLTQNLSVSLANKVILILGAGGAVRGILGALLALQPAEILLLNRDQSKAEELAQAFRHLGRIRAVAATDGCAIDLLIHARGLEAGGEIPGTLFHPALCCYDLSYSLQALTPFLQAAKTHGVTQLHDGLGMLVEQAAESFAVWHGLKPNTSPVLAFLRRNP